MSNIGLAISLCVLITAPVFSDVSFPTKVPWCNTVQDDIADYQLAVYDFAFQSYKHIGNKVSKHFAFSPLSVWITLAAMSEGADLAKKQNMFKFLNIPEDPCKRLKYYELATSRFVSNGDINITNTRALVLDEGVKINPVFHNIVFHNSLLNVLSAPIRKSPAIALAEIRRVISAKVPHVDISGNSLLMDSTEYNALWSVAFKDANVKKSPFYNENGHQIGSVDLMTTKMRVKVSYVRYLNTKFMELPVGFDSLYRIIIGITLGNDKIEKALNSFTITTLRDYLKGLRESDIPIGIAVPRISITTEHDVRKILESFGVKDLWKNATVTGHMSDPAALPSAYIQRATITLDTAGFSPAPRTQQLPKNAPTGLDPRVGHDFIVNRPFFLGLFDAKTYSCIMSAIYSEPTYKP
ncbi:serine protease inhibitor 77Ba-like [Anticarsia gemmatalis]|uniref:serine protease inhibitor 77Ba-like n=1 Tax=Anticarsia gemmatalis TaxID=129554 RepID=UPI003F76F93B